MALEWDSIDFDNDQILIKQAFKRKVYSFSVLFSSKKEVREKIVKKFLEFVEWSQSVAETDDATDVFQMNFDFLKWTD